MLQEKAKLQESLEKVYPWVQCEDPKVGMICTLCKKYGKPPQVQSVCGRQGELLTGTIPQNY